MITPVDLETTVFRRGLHGYSTAEVQEFMVRITHDYEHLYRENIELKEKIEALQNQLAQYQVMEETLRNAMVLAQESADEVKNLAQNKAELIVREAEQRGEHIKARLKEEIQVEIQKLTELKQQVEFFKCQFKSFLTSLLDIADHKLDMHIPWDKILASTQLADETCIAEAKNQAENLRRIAETKVQVENAQQIAETASSSEGTSTATNAKSTASEMASAYEKAFGPIKAEEKGF